MLQHQRTTKLSTKNIIQEKNSIAQSWTPLSSLSFNPPDHTIIVYCFLREYPSIPSSLNPMNTHPKYHIPNRKVNWDGFHLNPWDKQGSIHYWTEVLPTKLLYLSNRMNVLHTPHAHGQSWSMCKVDSIAWLQTGQIGSSLQYLLGNKLWVTNQLCRTSHSVYPHVWGSWNQQICPFLRLHNSRQSTSCLIRLAYLKLLSINNKSTIRSMRPLITPFTNLPPMPFDRCFLPHKMLCRLFFKSPFFPIFLLFSSSIFSPP